MSSESLTDDGYKFLAIFLNSVPHFTPTMSLSALHEYLLYYTPTENISRGSTTFCQWSRSDNLYAHAKLYFKAIYGNHCNVDDLALLACQDLVDLKVISLQDISSYKVFHKSSYCYVFLHSRMPMHKSYSRSGLKY